MAARVRARPEASEHWTETKQKKIDLLAGTLKNFQFSLGNLSKVSLDKRKIDVDRGMFNGIVQTSGQPVLFVR